MECELSEQRSSIPSKLRREVLIEAGHRCSIPICKQTPVDIHHNPITDNRCFPLYLEGKHSS